MSDISNFLSPFPVADVHNLHLASRIILGQLYISPIHIDKHGTQRIVLSANDEQHPVIRFKPTKAEIIGEEAPPPSLTQSLMPCIAMAFQSITMQPLLGLWRQQGNELVQLADPDHMPDIPLNSQKISQRDRDIFGLASASDRESLLMFTLFGNHLKPQILRLLRDKNILADAAYGEVSNRVERRQTDLLNSLYGGPGG